jgi:thiamine biosynthesis protein ThiI
LIVVDFKDLQKEIVKVCSEPYRTIMYKVYMVIIANNIAEQYGANFIGSGNSLGQVASQTLQNIRATRHFSERNIISPLIGYSKDDITKVAKKIGTFEPSTCDGTGDCCVMYLPKHPVTSAKIGLIDKFVKQVNPSLVTGIKTKLI